MATMYNGVDFDKVRQMLNAMLNVGPGRNPSSGWMGPHWYNGEAPPNNYLVYGQTPSDADVMRYINENVDSLRPAQGAAAQGPAAQGGSWGGSRQGVDGMFGGGSLTGSPLLDQLFQQAELDRLRKNVVNDKRERNIDDIYRDRERQADTELTALRDRAMGEVDNWGGVQAKLNEEAAKSALARQRTNLNAAGFNLSSHMPAFDARNARDLALVQQDLSEKKSDRKIRYDSQLTGNLAQTRAQLAGDRAAFLERPSDQGGIDANQLAQLAMAYGQGNGGQGFFDGQNAAAMAAAAAAAPPPRSPTPQWVDLFGFGQRGQGMAPQGTMAPQIMPQQLTPEGPMAPVGPSPVQLRLMREQAAKQGRIAARRAAGYTTPPRSTGMGSALRLTQPFRLF